MRRLSYIVAILASIFISWAALAASAPIAVQVDPSTGALFRPSTALFSSGNGLERSVYVLADGTTDNRATIQAALNNRTGSQPLSVHITNFGGGTGAVLIGSPLSVPSNTRIILDRYLTIRAASGSVAAGGAALLVNSDPVNGNSNISVEGGIWDGNNAGNLRVDGTNVGGVAIRFQKTSHIRFANLTIKDPTAFAMQFGDTTDGTFENIRGDLNHATPNEDLLHFNGPATGIYIGNVFVDGSDDTIALNADDASPYQLTSGAIANVVINGVYSITNSYRAVRLLSAGSSIRNVSIANMGGTFSQSGVYFSNLGSNNSDIANVTIIGISGVSSNYAINVATNVTSLTASVLNPSTNFNLAGSVGTLLLNGIKYTSATSSTTLYDSAFPVNTSGTSTISTTLSATTPILSLQNATTTSTTTPVLMLSLNRQNSSTNGLLFGVDGNADGVIAGNNSAVRIGRNVTGTMTDGIKVDVPNNLLTVSLPTSITHATNQKVVTFVPGSQSGIADFSTAGVGWEFTRPDDGAFAHALFSYNTSGGALNNFAFTSRNDFVWATNGGPTTAGEKVRLKSSSGNFLIGTTTDISGVSGGIKYAGVVVGSTDTLSGAGAVSVTKDTTKLTTTGTAQALTLADGVDGQIKRIIHDVDGGSAVLTPTTKTGFSTITFTNAGDAVALEFMTTRGWVVVGSYGVTIAP